MAISSENIEHRSVISPKGFLKRQAAGRAGRLIRFSSLLSLAGGIAILIGAWCLAKVVDGLIFAHATQEEVTPYLIGLLLTYLFRAFCTYGAEYTGAAAALEIKQTLRDALLRRFFRNGPQWLARERTGALVSSAAEGLDAMHAYYARYLPAMPVTALLPLLILLVVFPVDWLSGLIMLVTAPLIPFFMILIGRGAEKLNQRQWRRLTLMGGHFLDTVQGLTTLKLFNASRREAAVITRMCEHYRRDTMAVLRVAFLSSLALEFFATVSIALVAVLVGFRLLWGQVPFENAYLALLLAPEFYLPLRRMGTHYHARMEAIGAAEKVAELLEETAAPPTATQPLSLPHTPVIEFRDVSFAYGADAPVLSHVSFRLGAGEKLALVGESGSGKSTILALLLGFLQPTSGEVLIDGKPLSHFPPEDWHRHLSWVPQKPTLFTGDVASNIRMANPQLTDAELTALAESLGIDYLTQSVGEGGKSLSGGQVQRVAIARALARQPLLLLMDEPTAGLDAESESLIQQSLQRDAQGRSTIAAAHRLHTLRGFDHVLELHHGKATFRQGEPA